jgi:pimeloyl-ACP methyl ester carboxylesterase
MASLNYSIRGHGPSIVLLHGFPFNSTIWDHFAEKLGDSFSVITPDLPGFGRSENIENNFSIEAVAKEVLAFIESAGLDQPVLVGHSLGGYVALAMTALRPDLFSGLVLFHSTAYPDSEEKKQNRNKVLDFIAKNGVITFTSNFIQPLFADQSHPAIEKVREIAIQAQEDAVINYTKAMRDRPDRTSVLHDFPNRVLIISGERDGGISPQSVKEQAALSHSIDLAILEECAHMGMFEKEAETLIFLKQFASEVTDRTKKYKIS